MKEATNSNQQFWLLFIFICTTYVLFSISVKAQANQPNPIYSQLLDSAEILKLRRELDNSIELCNEVVTDAKALNDWESQARALNELSDIYRNMGDIEKAEKSVNASNIIINQYLSKENIERARNIFYKGKILRKKYSSNIENYIDTILSYYAHAKNINEQIEQPSFDFQSDLLFETGYFHKAIGNLDSTNRYYQELVQLLNTKFNMLDYRRGYFFYTLQ